VGGGFTGETRGEDAFSLMDSCLTFKMPEVKG
jgi:hypothetical protein